MLTDEPAIECNGYERSWIEDKFTAPEDGIYYYGLSIATHQEYNSFRLYGFKVEEIMENDMQATEIGDVREAVAERDNTCTVTVRNVGSKEQTNYKVRVLCDVDGEKVVVGETTDVPAIKPDATKKVQVKFRPTVEGIFNFYGEVVLEGDANANNNVTDPIELKVLDKDNAVWNKVVTSKKDESVDTHGPVVYWSTYDHTEHIYYAKEINGQAGDQIKRIGYVYSGNSNLTDRTAESEAQNKKSKKTIASLNKMVDYLNAQLAEKTAAAKITVNTSSTTISMTKFSTTTLRASCSLKPPNSGLTSTLPTIPIFPLKEDM